jgi:hypothetical protein
VHNIGGMNLIHLSKRQQSKSTSFVEETRTELQDLHVQNNNYHKIPPDSRSSETFVFRNFPRGPYKQRGKLAGNR